ncbi:MAG: hypothetical protein RRY08_05065, partial [Christensenella sp.]
MVSKKSLLKLNSPKLYDRANIFDANKPSNTPPKLNPRFNSMLPMACKYAPAENKSIVSMLNVENVLSPPNSPVVKNNFILEEIAAAFRSIPMMNPIKNPAIKLDKSVPNG